AWRETSPGQVPQSGTPPWVYGGCRDGKCRQRNIRPLNSGDMNTGWEEGFRNVYQRGVLAWKEGRRTAAAMFQKPDVTFLAGIGCTAQELFDFVDDAQRYGEPDFTTALAIAEIR